MKILIGFALLTTLISCNKETNLENGFTSVSKIKPLAKSETISEKFNKFDKASIDGKSLYDGETLTIPVKVSLTSNTIGHYALEDIMNPDEVLPEGSSPKQKKFLSRILDSLKYKIYNTGLGLGISNRVSYSTDFEFPEISSEYLKEVSVKKIFFALEPCDKKDLSCISRQNDKPSTFMFLDKFFVNLSIIENHDSLHFLQEPLQFLDKKQFNKAVDKAWGEQSHSFYDVNLARFENTRKVRKGNQNIRDNGKVFIARVDEENLIEAKKFFQREAFKGVIRDITLMGRSLFIELFQPELREHFFEIMNTEIADIRTLGINDLEGCTYLNCTSLNINPVNLVPMLEKSSHLKFDTFLSLKHLDLNDFKYSGYIELEVKVKLPL